MNTIYGQDLWNYGAGNLRNCGEGFGGRNAVAALRKDFSRFLRFAAVLLLMVVGVSGAKGQTDYSGIYYIASDGNAYKVSGKTNEAYTYNSSTPETNFYLVPASNPDPTKPGDKTDAYFDGTTAENPEKPFLTTYKVGQDSNPNWSEAVWVVTKVTDNDGTFYYIMHAATGKYVIYELFWPSDDGKWRRKCMHLDGTTPSENCKFLIEEHETGIYDIVPKSMRTKKTTEHKFWNIADRNRNSRHGLDADYYYGGLVGVFSYNTTTKDLDTNSRWVFEKAVPKASLTADDKVELTFPVTTTNTKICYTTDGTDPTGSSTQYSTPLSLPANAEDNMVVKARAFVSDGVIPTPNTTSSAVAIMLYKPDITLSQDTYTYNGGDNKPTVTAVSITTTQGTITADASAYSVPTYSDNVIDVGTPTVTVTDADATDTWFIFNASTTFTIAPKAVTITAKDASKVYNGTALTETDFTASALEDGDTHTHTVVMTEGSTITNVGTQPNVIATVDGVAVTTGTETVVGNYLVTTVDGELKVTAKTVTITANNASKTYDGTALTGGFTPSALETGDTHEFTIVMTEGSTITNVGNTSNVIATVDGVAVTTGTETAVGNYLVTTANGTLTVNAKAVTITANDASKPYNGLALTEDSFTATDLEAGDSHTFTVVMTGESTITDVGTQPNVIAKVDGIDVTVGVETTVGNYLVTTANGELEILAKAVTITANGATKEYDGNALTEAGFTTSALETGDTHTFTVTMTAESTITNRGTQPNVIATVDGVTVTTGTETAVGNYVVTTVNGTLKVTGRVITITAASDEKVYDGTALTNVGYTYDNTKLEEGDAITSVTVTGSQTIVGSSDNVPSAAVIKNGGNDVTANYDFTYVKGTLTVTPAPATVTADAKTKVYGDAEPTFTATVTGLKNNEAASLITYTFSRATGENVGEYTITPTGEATQGNYAVTFATGTLTITEKSIGDGTTPAEGIDIDITYDGTNYTVTVKQGDKTLELGDSKDYTWEGTGSDTYVVTVTGHGNYTSSAQATYIKVDFYDTTPDETSQTETAAAYYADQNLQASEGVEAWYVTNIENNELTVTKIEVGDGENKKSYIPANQPVLLLSEASTSPKGFTLKPYTDTEVVTIPASGEGSNLLKVVTAEGGLDVALAEVYMFSKGEFVLTKAGTMSKGKFYLENPNYSTSAPSRQILHIKKAGTTGINDIQFSDTDYIFSDIWYTIDGRRLNGKPTKKGLYIKRSAKGKNGSVTVIK